MREIIVDKRREAVIFRRCFFHPFFPVYRRTCEIALTDIGQPFITRSVDGGSGNKILLPTKRGYVYFRDDRSADNDTLRAIRKAQNRAASDLSNDDRTRLNQRANRIPIASKIVLVAGIAIIVSGLWFYYTRVLPDL